MMRDSELLWLGDLDPLMAPGCIHSRLQSHLLDDQEVRHVRPVTMDVNEKGRLIVLYRVQTTTSSGDRRTLLVHGLRGDGRVAIREQARWLTLHPRLGDALRFVHVDRERDLVLARFPYDLGLRRLPELSSARRVKHLNQELGYPLRGHRPHALSAPVHRVQILSYRPGRRCTACWHLHDRQDPGTGAGRAVVRLRAQPPPCTPTWRLDSESPRFAPRLLGASPLGTTIMEEWLPGVPFTRVRPQPTLPSVGALVGQFHEWTSQRFGSWCSTDPLVEEWDGLRRRARAALWTLKHLCPGSGPAVQALAQVVEELSLPRSHRPLVGIHGSLRPSRVLRQPSGLALVGLDLLRPGAAALDLASLAAHLATPDRDGEDILSALLDGYAEVRDAPPPTELGPYLLLMLLISAVEPYRLCEPGAALLALHRIHLAREWLPRIRRPSHRLLRRRASLAMAWSLP